jgi:hypothetical protein
MTYRNTHLAPPGAGAAAPELVAGSAVLGTRRVGDIVGAPFGRKVAPLGLEGVGVDSADLGDTAEVIEDTGGREFVCAWRVPLGGGCVWVAL